MFSRSAVLILGLACLLLCLPLPAGAGAVSPPGIELTSFEVDAPPVPRVGHRVEVRYTLKNVSGRPITFSPRFGISVGARYQPPQGKWVNLDFGHQYKGFTLGPGQSISLKSATTLGWEGQMIFWPAFHADGGWGKLDSEKLIMMVKPAQPPLAGDPRFQGGPGKTLVLRDDRPLPIQMFPPDNPWNQDISTLPKHPMSDQWVKNIGAHTGLHADFGSAGPGGHGIPYAVVDGYQPKLPVSFKYARESDPGPYPISPAVPTEKSGDRHALMLDHDNSRLYELFGVQKTNQGWKAGSGAIFDLTSNRLRPRGQTSADAAGLPILPGLVRYEEVYGLGEIRHALRFTAEKSSRGYIPPATHFASSVKTDLRPPMGARLRLRPDFDISPYPFPVQVILKALKKYGMFLADNGRNWFVSGAPDTRWPQNQLQWLKRVKGRDFEVVYTGETIDQE